MSSKRVTVEKEKAKSENGNVTYSGKYQLIQGLKKSLELDLELSSRPERAEGSARVVWAW